MLRSKLLLILIIITIFITVIVLLEVIGQPNLLQSRVKQGIGSTTHYNQLIPQD
ncbi:MAG: hypothetical protein Q8P73_03875 [bacterium]|nr:hypothetical protein [bacterium]